MSWRSSVRKLGLCQRLVIGLLLCLLFNPAVAWTQTNAEEEIPPLRPPLEEIQPGVWEQHGAALVVGSVLLLGMGAVAVWFAVRPRPPVAIPPGARARSAVQPFVGKPETGAILSGLSRVLRQYLIEAYALPAKEHTTAEFSDILRERRELGDELRDSTVGFLQQCDERKFSPRPPHTAMDAAAETLRLIELGERRAMELRSTAAESAQADRKT